MAASRHSYSLVNASDVEGQSGGAKSPSRSRSSKPKTLRYLLATALSVALVCLFYVIQGPSNHGGNFEPGWVAPDPGVRPYPAPAPEPNLVVDTKALHRFPQTTLTKAQIPTPAEIQLKNKDLFQSGTDRFVSHIMLDKPVYRPGETVRVSCYAFHALNSTIVSPSFSLSATVTVRDAKDVVIHNSYVSDVSEGVLGCNFVIPRNVAGGDFKLAIEGQVYGKSQAFLSKAERIFEVRATRTSNAKINKKIDFAKEGYGEGDKVTATIVVDKSDSETTVQFTATVDSEIVKQSDFVGVINGEAQFVFELPAKIARGEGVLTAKVSREGLLESTSKTIPIITQALDVGLFPEGGVLVPGAQQRVYVEVLDDVNGKPIDFVGEVFAEGKSDPLATVESLHEGRGVSDLFIVPSNAKRMYFKLTSPASVAGQTKDFPLRTGTLLEGDQVSLVIQEATFGNNLGVAISATKYSDGYYVSVYKREELVVTKPVKALQAKSQGLFSGAFTFNLGGNKQHYGVLRVTLFNRDNRPLAERLVFRMPPQALEVEISAAVVEDVSDDSGATSNLDLTSQTLHAAPADGVAVQIKTWSRTIDALSGKFIGPREPVSAVVALRVTDSALAATVDERELPPRLAEAVLLEAEVDRLKDVGQYLPRTAWAWHENKPNKKKGTFAQRLDLLLGTQGWRTFAYYDAVGFLKSGQAPLLEGLLYPAGLPKEAEGENVIAQTYTSPVSKLALERLMCIRPPTPPPRWAYMAAAAGPLRERMKGGGVPVRMFARAAAPPQAEVMDLGFELDEPVAGHNDDDAVELAQHEEGGEVGANPGDAIAPEVPQDVDNNAAALDAMAADEEEYAPAAAAKMAPEADQMVQRARFAPPNIGVRYQRVYAHPQRKYLKKEFAEGAKRVDFTETVYHNPSLRTICAKSECIANARFGLSESSTATFIVHADGFAATGGLILGGADMAISTAAPLEVDFTLPSIIVSGDKPIIPLSVLNRLGSEITLRSQIAPATLVHTKTRTFDVPAAQSARVYVELIADKPVAGGEREFNWTVSAVSADEKAKDAVTRSSVVSSRGFPAAQFSGGSLKPSSETKYAFRLPEDYVPGTLQVIARAYTSPVGRLTKALEELVREPHGCFEQTSSTTYPLVFVLQYLKTHTGSNSEVVAKAEKMLKLGYDKLVSYESSGGGFEWFGGSPGHEALTAYGLLQFAAMADPSVGLAVDPSMVERTKKWMDSRRDKKGGFLRNDRALDSFGAAPPHTTNAYITWALVRAGLLKAPKKDPELDSLIAKASESSDPYIIALAALSLYDAKERTPEQLGTAKGFAEKLVQMQDEKDGSVHRGAEDTITRSRGEALEIESTALAVLVWLHDSAAFSFNARMAVDFLASKCKNGRFASTQATALSLMAIVEFDRAFSKPLPLGVVELVVESKVIESIQFGDSKKQKATKTTTRADLDSVKELLGSSQDECKGGSEWNECGTACPLTCDSPAMAPCTMQCVARCQCPSDKPIMTPEGICVVKCDGAQATSNEEGVLSFDEKRLLVALAGATTTSKDVSMRIVLKDDNVAKTSEDHLSLPYSLSFKYSVVKPKRDAKFKTPAALELSIKPEFTVGEVMEGDVVTIRAEVRNIAEDEKGSKTHVPLVVAIVGIPGGFEPRTDQLRELKRSGKVDFVESKPGQVILYWRALKAGAVMEVPIQATAVVPGKYESPASRAYLFYNDEDKVWAKGFNVKIEPQQGTSKAKLFW